MSLAQVTICRILELKIHTFFKFFNAFSYTTYILLWPQKHSHRVSVFTHILSVLCGSPKSSQWSGKGEYKEVGRGEAEVRAIFVEEMWQAIAGFGEKLSPKQTCTFGASSDSAC